MRTLVVWARHLTSDGDGERHGDFDVALRETVVRGLRRAGHDTTVIDLLAERYQPVMGRDEWRAYRAHAPEPDAVVARHVDAVTSAEQLVFVYATVWFGLPALLKGWLERTMLPGVAFDFGPDGVIRGELTSLRRIVAVVTYDTPRWRVHLVGDAGRRTLTRALRLSCRRPWRVRSTWIPRYGNGVTAVDAASFLRRVEHRLGR